jgi:hypothetical protein
MVEVRGVDHEAFEDSKLIYVDMFEILGKKVSVETTHGEVMDMLKMSKTDRTASIWVMKMQALNR